MQQKPQSEIHLKRSAFRSKIRRQWLDKYFQQKRIQLLKQHQNQIEAEEIKRKRWSEWLDELPSNEAVQKLQSEFDDNKEGMVRFMKENLDNFINTAHNMNIRAFSLYSKLLNNMVIYYRQSKEAVMFLTLQMMLRQGKRLMRQDSNQKNLVIINLVEYILVLSDSFFNMSLLQVRTVCEVLKESLNFSEQQIKDLDIKQCYVQTSQIFNQFLISSVKGLDQQQEQSNIKSKNQDGLIFSKQLVIRKIFHQNLEKIKNLIKNACIFSDDIRITTITLKVLTNVTFYSMQEAIFQSIFQFNYSHLMLSVMSNFPQSSECFLLLIKIMKNLLIFDKRITENNIKKMHFQELVKNYNSIKGENITLIEQFCQMSGLIVFFMEDFPKILMYLMEREIIDILIEGCELVKNENALPLLLVCFSILMNADKNFVQIKIRQNAKIFEDLADHDSNKINQTAKDLLEQIFSGQETENHPTINSNQEKDVQI